MDLDHVLNELHFAPDRGSSSDWRVDWDDAPTPFKHYRGLRAFELDLDIPHSLPPGDALHPSVPTLFDIGHFLWYSFGLTQVSHFAQLDESPDHAPSLLTTYRRFVPSGGGLYPSELYIYLKIKDIPTGIYHYDVARHRLLLLREGNVDAFLEASMAHCAAPQDCFAFAFVSTLFWKNFFKYHNFSYRLQGLDAGALIGQMRLVADRFGYGAEVCFRFLDRALNHLLGLNHQEESVYAVVPLWMESLARFNRRASWKDACSTAALCSMLPELRTEYDIGSKRVKPCPVIVALNMASFIDNPVDEQPLPTEADQGLEPGVQTVQLLEEGSAFDDFLSICQNRQSPGLHFVYGGVNLRQLGRLLKDAMSQTVDPALISLYLCVHGIDDLPDGAYQYDGQKHQLRMIKAGDHRTTLLSGITMPTVNLYQTPICVHLAGSRDHWKEFFGYRGHRIQHMQAGILLQSLLLAASSLGMNGHPLLDYDTNLCDSIYDLAQRDQITLVQVPIGRHLPGASFSGKLHM